MLNRRWTAVVAAALGLAAAGTLGTAGSAQAQELGVTVINVTNFRPVSFTVDVLFTQNGAAEVARVSISDPNGITLGLGAATGTAAGSPRITTLSGPLSANGSTVRNGESTTINTYESENDSINWNVSLTGTCRLDSSGNGYCS